MKDRGITPGKRIAIILVMAIATLSILVLSQEILPPPEEERTGKLVIPPEEERTGKLVIVGFDVAKDPIMDAIGAIYPIVRNIGKGPATIDYALCKIGNRVEIVPAYGYAPKSNKEDSLGTYYTVTWFEQIDNVYEIRDWGPANLQEGDNFVIHIEIYENAPSSEGRPQGEVWSERLRGAGDLIAENDFFYTYHEKEVY